MRLKQIKRLEAIVSRQHYALQREELDYFKGLLEEFAECMTIIKDYNKETKESLTEEERILLLAIQKADLENRKLFEEQMEMAKNNLRNIRINESKSMQYVHSYGTMQGSGIFFDKKGR